MNKVFIIVKILEYRYGFLLNNKKSAICKIIGKLTNGSIINIIAYDYIADKCLRILKKEKIYMVEGRVNSNMEIVIENIKRFDVKLIKKNTFKRHHWENLLHNTKKIRKIDKTQWKM